MRALLTYMPGPSNRQMLSQALLRAGQFNAAQAVGTRYGQ
jgi:hypothetical protein